MSTELITELIIWAIMSAILFLFPAWRIFKRAGLNPALSLLVLIPYLGFFIASLVVAVMRWPAISQDTAPAERS